MGNIAMYKNGNYKVMLDLDNGSKMRFNNEDCLIPDHAESIDVTISKHCTMNCPFCYAGCSYTGKHADILSYSFIDNLPPYTELALNGNEPLHPDLVPFLEYCKHLKLVPSLTVNQFTFTKHTEMLKELCDKKLVYGLGVSLSNPTFEFIKSVKQFPNAVIHVIAGIVDEHDIEMLSGHGLKVLVLGYKNVGRGEEFYDENGCNVLGKIKWLKDNLKKYVDGGAFDTVCFDNLALEQLDIHSWMDDDKWSEFYCGGDGQYTFYVDMVDGMYYKNSMSKDGHPITDDAVEMFNVIRNECA